MVDNVQHAAVRLIEYDWVLADTLLNLLETETTISQTYNNIRITKLDSRKYPPTCKKDFFLKKIKNITVKLLSLCRVGYPQSKSEMSNIQKVKNIRLGLHEV